MSVPVRLAGFAAVLALVLLAGLGVGRAVGPVGPAGSDDAGHAAAEETTQDAGHGPAQSDAAAPEAAHTGDAAHGDAPSGITGLAVSADGYTLRPLTPLVRPAGTQELRFLVDGPGGQPVTAFDETHERDLHLVVVRRDTTGFQHLHPEQGADGSWTTPLTLDEPGAYRLYADFAPAGEPARTLATDVLVPGDFAPQPLPAPSTSTQVGDLEVSLDGALVAGEESELAFTVTRDGEPVELGRYLGAAGHLVVLREGDLGYLHVHADEDELSFAATAPSPGRYRLFLQLSVDGAVRTADLAVEAS